MVLGILGILFLCVPFMGHWIALPAGIVATILGAVALSNSKRDPSVGGQGMAITGLVLGLVVLAIALLVMLFVASFFTMLAR